MPRNSNVGSRDIRPVANALANLPGTTASLTAEALLTIQDALDSISTNVSGSASATEVKNQITSIINEMADLAGGLENLAGNGLAWDPVTGTITIAFHTLDATIFRQFGLNDHLVLADGVLARAGLFGIAVVQDAAIASANISKLLAGTAHFNGLARFQHGTTGPYLDIDADFIQITSDTGATPHTMKLTADGITIHGTPGPTLFEAGSTIISADTIFTGQVAVQNGFQVGANLGLSGTYAFPGVNTLTFDGGMLIGTT